jgi:hypothetical protein
LATNLRQFSREFSRGIETYSHVTAADFGYKSATLTSKIDITEISDWLEYGLGRHIETVGSSGLVVWEGFVDKISVSFGSLVASRGPLFDISNRVTVAYTPIIDVTVDPPVTGSATETPIAEDTDSQAMYGIIEKIVSGGQRLDDGTYDEAEEIRDLYLSEMAFPYTDENINVGASAYPIITLECLGYKQWFSAYVFNDYTSSTVTLDTKIKAVLDADPNSIFSTNQDYITANAQITNRLEDKNRYAATVISDITSLGDSSDNRWIFKVLNNRICRYESIPTSIKYFHTLSGKGRSNIADNAGNVVEPWHVQAGEWVQITDFLIGQGGYATLREDPRVLFAEEVTYTMPFGLSITGSRVNKLTQRLKQLGVGGA